MAAASAGQLAPLMAAVLVMWKDAGSADPLAPLMAAVFVPQLAAVLAPLMAALRTPQKLPQTAAGAPQRAGMWGRCWERWSARMPALRWAWQGGWLVPLWALHWALLLGCWRAAWALAACRRWGRLQVHLLAAPLQTPAWPAAVARRVTAARHWLPLAMPSAARWYLELALLPSAPGCCLAEGACALLATACRLVWAGLPLLAPLLGR